MVQTKIKIPTEDKEGGLAITVTQEVEVAVEVTEEATGEASTTNPKGTLTTIKILNHDWTEHPMCHLLQHFYRQEKSYKQKTI